MVQIASKYSHPMDEFFYTFSKESQLTIQINFS